MKQPERGVRVTRISERRMPKGIRKLSRALIALAQAQLEAEARAEADAKAAVKKGVDERRKRGDAA